MASTSSPSYCSELLWNGRTPDQDFQADEILFHRIEKFDERGMVNAVESVRCPDTSVNRRKYSEPKHALCGQNGRFLNWKVAQFYVRDIPATVTNRNDGKTLGFRIEHDPALNPDENYAHSEILAFHNQERKKRLPPTVEKEFRQIIADAMNRQLSQGQPQQP